MKKLLKAITSRLAVTCYLILIQLSLLFVTMLYFTSSFIYFYFLMVILSLFLIIAIINDDSNPTFKMAWIIPMLIFPIFGAPLYLIFGRKKVSKRIIRKLYDSFAQIKEQTDANNDEILKELKDIDVSVYKQFSYISHTALGSVYKNTETKFLATGEEFFENLITELNKAEKFIFLEYFIIAKGKMWDSVLDILVEKAAQGVEIGRAHV